MADLSLLLLTLFWGTTFYFVKGVLQVASLIGRQFDLVVLERVVDMPEDDLLDALDAAVRAGMLLEAQGVPGRYSFAHALLRKTLEQTDRTAIVPRHSSSVSKSSRVPPRPPPPPAATALRP